MGQWRQPNAAPQRYPRVATAVPVRITTVDPEVDPSTGQSFFRSAVETTANLSHGGAFVRSWEPLAAGRRVVVTIELTGASMGHDSIQLVGTVAWTRRQLAPRPTEQTGYGIEFDGALPGEMARLDQFLNAFGKKPTQPSAAPDSALNPSV